MDLANRILILLMIFWLPACSGNRVGSNKCATKLTYTTNQFTSGEQAVREAGQYLASFSMGADDFLVTATVDTAAANLVINANDYEFGADSAAGRQPFIFRNGSNESYAINAKDSLDVGCLADINTRFALASKYSDAKNILGLAYGDPDHRPHEKVSPPFFDQFVKTVGMDDVFSLALCGSRGNSRLILGGVDEDMKGFIGDFIPVIEKTAFVVPAERLKLAHNKRVLASFPHYDPITKTGARTLIDSGSSFLLLPTDMAKTLAEEVKKQANSLDLLQQFPEGFFRTERSTSTKVVHFAHLAQIRQFPSLEIDFRGADGKTKTLEISPLHYFKEMDNKDTLYRTFAVRESHGDVVLGQPFLENHYTFFDRKNATIGFANIGIACAE